MNLRVMNAESSSLLTQIYILKAFSLNLNRVKRKKYSQVNRQRLRNSGVWKTEPKKLYWKFRTKRQMEHNMGLFSRIKGLIVVFSAARRFVWRECGRIEVSTLHIMQPHEFFPSHSSFTTNWLSASSPYREHPIVQDCIEAPGPQHIKVPQRVLMHPTI